MCDNDLAELADLAAEDITSVLEHLVSRGAVSAADQLRRALRCAVEIREQLREREATISISE